MSKLEDNSETKNLLNLFIQQIKEREQLKSQNKPYLNDNSLMEKYYTIIMGKESEKIFKKSYVSNEFFIKNRDKYLKNQESQNEWKLFESPEEYAYEDKLKLNYFDCFLTRYVYHVFTRWCWRIGKAAGIIEQ